MNEKNECLIRKKNTKNKFNPLKMSLLKSFFVSKI